MYMYKYIYIYTVGIISNKPTNEHTAVIRLFHCRNRPDHAATVPQKPTLWPVSMAGAGTR